jgi:hypothetical protein
VLRRRLEEAATADERRAIVRTAGLRVDRDEIEGLRARLAREGLGELGAGELDDVLGGVDARAAGGTGAAALLGLAASAA